MEGVGLPMDTPAAPALPPRLTPLGSGPGISPPKAFFFIQVYYYYWLRWVFVVAGSLSLAAMRGFSRRWLLSLRSTGSRRMGLSSCGKQA